MDGDARDLELLLSTVRAEVAAFRHDPRLTPTTGSRGAALRDHVLDLLGAVEHRLQQQPAAGAPEHVRRAFARSLRQSIVMLRGAHAALPWLAATREPQVNLGSLYLTEEYARILVGADVDLVVVPDPEFMYSTTSWPFLDVVASTSGFTPTTSRRPVGLNYPLTDADRLLVHPIFAHELGHPAVDEHRLVDRVDAALNGDTAFTSALGGIVSSLASSTGMTQAQATGYLRAWLRNWIEEVLCDLLAVEAAGPAYIWAFATFVLPFSYGEGGDEHPPNTVRMRLALEHLDRRGWRPYMQSVAPGVTAWLDDIAADATGRLSYHFAFFRDQLLGHADVLQDAAISCSGGGWFDPANAVDHAAEAARLLAALILPSGLEGPLDLRSIVLGGWERALESCGDNPSGLVTALADHRLQDLVGKGVEMSTVSASWPVGP